MNDCSLRVRVTLIFQARRDGRPERQEIDCVGAGSRGSRFAHAARHLTMPKPIEIVAFLLGTVLTVAVATPIVTSSVAVDVVTYHNDNTHTGQNLSETTLTPATVNTSTFGKTGFFPVDGKVDAQPLFLSSLAIPGMGTHDVLYVATEHDSVYALDAASGSVLARIDARLGRDHERCSGVLTGHAGDRHHLDACHRSIARSQWHYLRGGDVQERVRRVRSASPCARHQVGRRGPWRPETIQATFPGTGAGSSGGPVIFDPGQYEERAGLMLLNGQIITAWTSHCDIDPYTGWVMAYDASTLAQVSVLNVTPNGSRGGFWMAGAGPASDSTGNIYLLDGNGTFDTALNANGFPSQGNFGNAFLKISTSGGLQVADYFTMFNTVAEDERRSGSGSGRALVLPDLIDGMGRTRHLAVGAGKDAHIYVVDRDSMGKFNPSANRSYQDITGSGSSWDGAGLLHAGRSTVPWTTARWAAPSRRSPLSTRSSR